MFQQRLTPLILLFFLFIFTGYKIPAHYYSGIDILNPLKLNDYLIVKLYHGLSSFEPNEPGKLITIPSDYAKTIILNINRKKKLLDIIKVYDDIDLWENYTNTNIELNTDFTGTYFDIKNLA